MKKMCARCDKMFEEEEKEPFITCQGCRRPLTQQEKLNQSGCHYWQVDDKPPNTLQTLSSF